MIISLEHQAARIASYLTRQLGLSRSDEEVLIFSLNLVINTLLGYVAIILVAWPLGVIGLAVIAALTTASLRIFSGGAHATSSLRCVIFGAIIYPILGLAAQYLPSKLGEILGHNIALTVRVSFPVAMAFLAFLVIYLYAPAETPGKPIQIKQKREKLRLLSFVIVALWLALIVFANYLNYNDQMLLTSTLGLSWQAFTMTPWGYDLVARVDRAFSNIVL